MKRNAYNYLLLWKNKPNNKRKPLILRGARQVGKTWLLEEFGKEQFESVAYINFEEQKHLSNLFEADFNTDRILRAIELSSGIKLVAGKTLIIFDEIQSVNRGLLSLKYLLKNAPEFHIAAAGSLLGISMHNGDSFPVGKVEFIDIFPLSLEEFMLALGKEGLLNALKSMDWKLISTFSAEYIDILRQYYYVGGMPEVVNSYIENKDFTEVREIQNALLLSYQADFSKHPPKEIIPRIKLVWENIPSQLSKENKKFIYNSIKKGSRAKDYELAIEWLKEAGVIHKVQRVNNPSLPLGAFIDIDAFKLFTLDIGLLGAMCQLDAKSLIDGNLIFTQYKGALTEQFVLQQLICNNKIDINYWSANNSQAELDFIVQINGKIIPIEVKAEENLKAKSLKVYIDKYSPEIAIRTSMSKYREETSFTNLPLYAIFLLDKLS